jgi:hypothetical protein
MTAETSSWAILVGLGAFHGINPGMGWLFAVALGMQERRRAAVLWALVPLCAGHALAVVAAVAIALVAGAVMPMQPLRWAIAAVLIWLGAMRFVRHRHPRWASMRVGMRGLTWWSFLMATGHGAGLMVLPVVVGLSTGGGAHAHNMPATTGGAEAALVASALHTASYIAITASIAVLVFEKLGVGILRRAWLNLDVLWACALVTTGVFTLGT